jgi:hypothetical protein
VSVEPKKKNPKSPKKYRRWMCARKRQDDVETRAYEDT